VTAPVGLALGSQIPPERIGPSAALGEELGFSELWLAEDYFFTGGISGAAIALAATRRVPVGLGIVSARVRHPAALAMECSTLARAFPGRFWPGIGLGLPIWLRQMGVYPRSQLGAMRECVTSVRALLRGDELSALGDYADFDTVSLAYPLAEPPPVYMGVHGPRMMRLAGEIADGTVLSIFAGVEYVRWARALVAPGQADAGRSGEPHRMPVFVLFCVDRDPARARAEIAPVMAAFLALMPRTALGDVYGLTEQLVELAAGGPERVLEGMPEQWVADLCVAGDPEECAAQIRRLLDAGGDSVVLFPAPAERAEEIIRLAAAEVLTRL
jgi:alkanesulfonate monooxygenase SsuD/methylene tetrahydromethanopterin reductase-like flavin-dependent oxidoreductase (luciferase family)